MPLLWHFVLVGIPDFDIIPEHIIESDLQTGDSGSLNLTLLDLLQEIRQIAVMGGNGTYSRDDLMEKCLSALHTTDMVMISGGSSVGARDFTVEVLEALPHTDILVHGISISPGKPTILARSGQKPFWGLPGHADSAMVFFDVVVRPFIEQISGQKVHSIKLAAKKRIKADYKEGQLLPMAPDKRQLPHP